MKQITIEINGNTITDNTSIAREIWVECAQYHNCSIAEARQGLSHDFSQSQLRIHQVRGNNGRAYYSVKYPYDESGWIITERTYDALTA